MRERLSAWLELADERLRPQDLPAFWMLGNDDPPELAGLLDAAPWGSNAEDRVLELGDGHSLVSLGYSNPTPWDSYRELSEEELGARIDALFAQVAEPRRAVLNAHVPPYMSGLDEAPVLDARLQVQTAAGQVKMGAVGSTAVRAGDRAPPADGRACTATCTSRPDSAASRRRWRSTPAATTARGR